MAIGNILTRLQGLKNVSGRRVMPGQGILQELETETPDVEGTSNPIPKFENLKPKNLPENDLGGELTPQSYDVRANTVETLSPESPSYYMHAQSPKKQGINWTEFGRSLGNFVKEPKEEPNMIESSNYGAPSEEKSVLGEKVAQNVKNLGNAIKKSWTPELSPEFSNQFPDVAKNLPQTQKMQQNFSQENPVLDSDITKAMENPWKYSAYGSANQIANHPALQAEFKNITGIDFEPQLQSQIADAELAMKSVEDAFNGINDNISGTAEQIKQRILNNQSTDSDKYLIGLALLMPLIVGGLFGKEAGIGALGGTAQGFSDILGKREKGIREDQESLLDINKQQAINQEKIGNLALERAQLEPKLRKNLPEQPNKHLIGTREIDWKDPETGENKKGHEILPGFVVKPEFVTENRIKDTEKAARELAATKSYVDKVDKVTDDLSQIIEQLDDPSSAWKMFTSLVSKGVPGSLSGLTQDVMFNGKMQNSGMLLEQQMGFLANLYAQSQKLGQLDRAAQSHMSRIMTNPTNTLANPRDALNQILEIRRLAQTGLVDDATNLGFYPEFIVKSLEEKNNPLFQRLNDRQESSDVQDIVNSLIQNG